MYEATVTQYFSTCIEYNGKSSVQQLTPPKPRSTLPGPTFFTIDSAETGTKPSGSMWQERLTIASILIVSMRHIYKGSFRKGNCTSSRWSANNDAKPRLRVAPRRFGRHYCTHERQRWCALSCCCFSFSSQAYAHILFEHSPHDRGPIVSCKQQTTPRWKQ